MKGISSMATRQVLADLTQAWKEQGGEPVDIESVGGVDAAQRVQVGEEAFDLVFLASNAIDKLEAAGRVLPGSKVDLMLSSTAVAVPAATTQPDIRSEEAVRAAVLAAPSIGFSTGPSGIALQKLFERWGIAEEIKPRMVQARPGVPVGSMVASGEVALGFQQLSELIHVQGIQIVGALPAAIAIDTVFSAAVVSGAANAEAAQRLLAFMASPQAAEAKRRQGMEPA
ncbi:substrate-binding domain-containing protein [Comamonas resistens]|uniref:Extracellular solute-binding protein n=1 Tax=Comamonas resistens TaxID=3046670 RepID=A0ABY8SWZ5_9BURK|nr:substrate-binding domain-containing protein [Comamonas resistens]MDL5037752.1 extracellular solute-binding protein [Comamonas resistens]WHS67572.1 extracellular solute-binding protein [Comamonas resistens]